MVNKIKPFDENKYPAVPKKFPTVLLPASIVLVCYARSAQWRERLLSKNDD